MAVVKKTIDPKHKLPCDWIVGAIRFRKGVKLETVRAAAERWYNAAVAASNPPKYNLDELLAGVTPENRHPET